MSVKDVSARLGRDELAFYFGGDGSIPAELLGDFLRRAAAVTRRNGIEIEVVALESGSLSVVMKALKKAGSRIQGEFGKAPLATTAAAAALLSSMGGDKPVPLQRVGAEIVINGKAENIYVVTTDNAYEVMDAHRARAIVEREKRTKPRLVQHGAVQQIMDDGGMGTLSGVVLEVEGVFHFRPDNRNFLVPIDMRTSPAAAQLFEGGRFRMRADLRLLGGQPDSLVVYRAVPY